MLHHSPTRSRPRAMGHGMSPKLFRRMGDTWHSHYHHASDRRVRRAVAPPADRRPPAATGGCARYGMLGGRTALRVSELTLGTGAFGTRRAYGAEPEEVRREAVAGARGPELRHARPTIDPSPARDRSRTDPAGDVRGMLRT